MRRQKAKKQQRKTEFYTVNALSLMTGRDRATVTRAAARIEPSIIQNGKRKYTLEAIEQALRAKPDKSLKDSKLEEEIRKLRLKNDRDEGKVVVRVEIATMLRLALSKMRGILEQKLVNELATAVAGLEPAQVRIKTKQIYDEAMAQCARLDAEMG